MFNKQEYCKVYKEDKIRSVLKNNELFSSVLNGPAMITPLTIYLFIYLRYLNRRVQFSMAGLNGGLLKTVLYK